MCVCARDRKSVFHLALITIPRSFDGSQQWRGRMCMSAYSWGEKSNETGARWPDGRLRFSDKGEFSRLTWFPGLGYAPYVTDSFAFRLFLVSRLSLSECIWKSNVRLPVLSLILAVKKLFLPFVSFLEWWLDNFCGFLNFFVNSARGMSGERVYFL